VLGIDDAVEITASTGSACARRRDGSVWCWGENSGGQLGDGTNRPRPTPGATIGVSDAAEAAASFSLGISSDGHACARRADRAVLCWGENRNTELGRAPSTVSLP
jgi:alpha-tubulin suppressor-like RCC1 family protein